MGGVGEHVHHAGGDEAVAMFVDEAVGITGEGAGVAGDVHNPFGFEAGDVRQHGLGASTGRVEEDAIVGFLHPGLG